MQVCFVLFRHKIVVSEAFKWNLTVFFSRWWSECEVGLCSVNDKVGVTGEVLAVEFLANDNILNPEITTKYKDEC